MASTPSPVSSVAASMRRAQARRASTSRPESISSRIGDRGREHAELQRLVALLLAAGEVDVQRRGEEPLVEADALGLGARGAPRPRPCRGPTAAKAASSTSTSGHAGHLGGVLHGEEQPGLGPLPRRQASTSTPSRVTDPAEHLVAGPAHDHVGQRRLARAVRAHDGVDLAGADREVDPREDLLAGHAGPQAADLEHVVISPSRRAPPRSRRRRRAPRTRAPAWWRQRLRLARLERERAAVLPALELALVAVHLALGERDVLVAAAVADGVDVVVDAHDARCGGRRPSTWRAVARRAGRRARPTLLDGRASCAAPPGAWRRRRRRGRPAASATGKRSSTSSKKPATISRSATAVGTPRLSR